MADRPDPAAVELLLLDLGGRLLASGDAVADIQDRLRRVAFVYGYPTADISVLPTMVFVSVEPGGRTRLGHPPSQADPRLDQSAAVFRLLHEIEDGELDPVEARQAARDRWRLPPRFGTVGTILGHIVMTVGLALVLQPTGQVVALAVLFGFIVGVLKIVGSRSGVRVGFLLPVIAAALISALAFLLVGRHSVAQPVRALTPPLVTFLPGGLLAMAMYDLAAGEVITGASRFVSGFLQLLLLGLGIVIGAELAGLPAAKDVTDEALNTIGWWAPWIGVLVFGIGVSVFFSAPRGSLVWLLVVLYAAWIGQFLGRQVLSPDLSGFIGGLVAFPVAILVERARAAPPSFVTFLPAFWLLVPGSLGLVGLTEIVGTDQAAGVDDFQEAVITIGAVALGVLAGATLVQWLRAQRGRNVLTGTVDPDQPTAEWVRGVRHGTRAVKRGVPWGGDERSP
jgi:uncharacterized membrane protein YjjP (DUF1212 family)